MQARILSGMNTVTDNIIMTIMVMLYKNGR